MLKTMGFVKNKANSHPKSTSEPSFTKAKNCHFGRSEPHFQPHFPCHPVMWNSTHLVAHIRATNGFHPKKHWPTKNRFARSLLGPTPANKDGNRTSPSSIKKSLWNPSSVLYPPSIWVYLQFMCICPLFSHASCKLAQKIMANNTLQSCFLAG